jgi:hypothetical protein
LQGQGRLSLHSLRHSFASLLIAKRLNVVFVSRQLGHASAATTLDVYAHLFQNADHAVPAREALQASYETTRIARPKATDAHALWQQRSQQQDGRPEDLPSRLPLCYSLRATGSESTPTCGAAAR